MPSSAPTDVTIRAATRSDATSIAAIYNHYITETVVTFEEQPVTADELALRLDKVQAAALPWLVAEHQGQLLGYAYAGLDGDRAHGGSSARSWRSAPRCGRRRARPQCRSGPRPNPARGARRGADERLLLSQRKPERSAAMPSR
jgi:hypothetical protein